jgi:hypothetical protein
MVRRLDANRLKTYLENFYASEQKPTPTRTISPMWNRVQGWWGKITRTNKPAKSIKKDDAA